MPSLSGLEGFHCNRVGIDCQLQVKLHNTAFSKDQRQQWPLLLLLFFFSIADSKPELKDAFKILYSQASHWENIGVLLGMDSNELDKIRDNEREVENCLRAMLSKWLKHVDPVPTWKGLAEAMEVIDQSLAEKIRRHSKSCH